MSAAGAVAGSTARRAARLYLSRRYHFAASHRLHAAGLSDEQNASAYGKCNNPHGHGHNYTVEVTVSGAIDESTGMVTNLADLDAFAQSRLLDRFDCCNLNSLPCFASTVPTTENLLVEVERIFGEYPHARLERVRIEETSNTAFTTEAGGGRGERGR